MKKRNKIFTAASCSAALTLGFVILESRRELGSLTVRNVKISYNKDTDTKPLRIAFFADYHEACEGKLNKRIADAVGNACPDLIMIGGDMLNGYEMMDELPSNELVDLLYRIAPVIMAPGNHEKRAEQKVYKDNEMLYDKFMAGIEDKVHYLKNTSELFSINGKWIRVFGLDLPLDYYKRREKKTLSADEIVSYIGKPEKDDSGIINLLLAHNPEYFESYAEWGADITLSGHFHGGLINIPLIGGIISPRLKILPEYTKGLYESRNCPGKLMYLSSGIGQHSIKIKVNNVPEIVILDLEI